MSFFKLATVVTTFCARSDKPRFEAEICKNGETPLGSNGFIILFVLIGFISAIIFYPYPKLPKFVELPKLVFCIIFSFDNVVDDFFPIGGALYKA